MAEDSSYFKKSLMFAIESGLETIHNNSFHLMCQTTWQSTCQTSLDLEVGGNCWDNLVDAPILTLDRPHKHKLPTINRFADQQSAILSHQQTLAMTIRLISDQWPLAYQSYRRMVIRTFTIVDIRSTYFDYRYIVGLPKIVDAEST